MTSIEVQIVMRSCQNCGCSKREHKPNGLKCPTKLKVSRWLPWTFQEYEQAVAAGKAAVGAL